MAQAKALLDKVTGISPPSATAPIDHPSARFMMVAFGSGRSGLLDRTSHRGRTWGEVLESLRESRQPVYVEIDPETDLITDVLLPIRYHVVRTSRSRDGLQVELAISHARHFLRRSHTEFAALTKVLEEAQKSGSPVLVVENDAHEIVLVRPADHEPSNGTQVREGQ